MDLAQLQLDFPLQADRIVTDPQGSAVELDRQTLLALYEAELHSVPNSSPEAEVAAAHDQFCLQHPCLGTPITHTLLERFGHVMSMNSFRWFVATPSTSAGGLPPRSGMLGPVPTRAMSSAEANAILLSKLTAEQIRPDGVAIWCFQSPSSPEHPFDGLDVSLLPCRLGLKRSKETGGPDSTWIAFSVNPAPTEWHRPTFADTTWAFLVDWKPGGLTVASPEYACGPGLPEAIGRGVTYGQLTAGAGPFSASWPIA